MKGENVQKLNYVHLKVWFHLSFSSWWGKEINPVLKHRVKAGFCQSGGFSKIKRTQGFLELYKQSSNNLHLGKMFTESFCSYSSIQIVYWGGYLKDWNKLKCTATVKVLSMSLRSQLYLKCDSIIAKRIAGCVCVRACMCACVHLLHEEATEDLSVANKIHAWTGLANARCKCLQLNVDFSSYQVTLDWPQKSNSNHFEMVLFYITLESGNLF